MVTQKRRRELEAEFPFLKGDPDDAINVFNDMITTPDVFIHDGQGNFSLVDIEAAKKMPGVQEIINEMDRLDRVAIKSKQVGRFTVHKGDKGARRTPHKGEKS